MLRQMKEKLRFRVLLVFTILCMVGIFLFSSKPADESSEMSHEVGRLLCRMVVPGYEQWPQEKQELLADKVDYPVRKAAHAAEYAVLGMLIYGTLLSSGWKKSPKFQLLISILLGAIYAVSDEIHQLFVPGRAGMITDVLIDTAGVMLGTVLIYSLTSRREKKQKSEKTKKKHNKKNANAEKQNLKT